MEFEIKAKRELDALVKRSIEHHISTDIKNDVFISMVCDDLLMNSELNEIDIDQIDHKIKRGIAEKLRVLTTREILSLLSIHEPDF